MGHLRDSDSRTNDLQTAGQEWGHGIQLPLPLISEFADVQAGEKAQWNLMLAPEKLAQILGGSQQPWADGVTFSGEAEKVGQDWF